MTTDLRLKRARTALRLVAATSGGRCSNYWGTTTCRTNGRKKNAKYGADRWCDACIALDGLEKSRG